MDKTKHASPPEARKQQITAGVVSALIAIIVVAVGMIATLAGFEMMAMIVVVLIGWILVIVLLWIATGYVATRIVVALVFTACTICALYWVVKYDRPILTPEIGGIVTQNFDGRSLGLDVETLVKNSGRQNGYADKWQLVLVIDGTRIEGHQLYGQALPAKAVIQPEISDQEFPPGKPVRGWLFFGYPSVSHEYAVPYFTCGSPLMGKVELRLSVWDSKLERKWTRIESLKDLGNAACTPLKPAPQSAQPVEPKAHPTAHQKQTPTAPPVKVNGDVNQANSGGCNQLAIGNNNTNNCVPPAPKMSWTQKPYDLGPNYKPAVIVYMSFDGNLNLPAFMATCDRPCEVQEGSVDRVMTTPGPILHGGPTEAGIVLDAPRPLGAGEHPYMIIESKDNLPIRVLNVVTLTKSQLPAGVE